MTATTTAKTYDRQTATFLAVVGQNMPELSGDVMQGWIENPRALQNALRTALCPPETAATPREFKTWKTVKIGTHKNPKELSKSLTGNGFRISDWAADILKSDALQYPQQQTSTEWWVYPEVENTSTGLDITGGVVTFFINPNAPQYAPVPSSTFIIGPTLGAASTTEACSFTTEDFLDDPVGNIEQSVCDVFNYLFLPSDDEQADLYQRFQGQWTQISNRVPFGYVGIINTAFTDFQEGTNTSTLITTTTYAALSSVLDPLKTGISFLLILLLGFWIFYFARTITL